MGFASLLTILFIGLKLTGYIAWSWLWVLAPMWIPPVLIVLLCVGIFFGACLIDRVSPKEGWRIFKRVWRFGF